MKEYFIDKDLGKVFIVRRARSKRVVARRKEYGVELSIPACFALKKALGIFEEMKPRILKLSPRNKIFFDENIELETYSFKVQIQKTNLQKFYAGLQNNVLQISCPVDTDFKDDNVQNKILKYIESALRIEAKRIFPIKLKDFANRYGFCFSEVKINKSRSRWGSCSFTKNINLSYYCLFLPEHLIDYIILHELCHTVETNHGENFWKLLDQVTNNRAKQLRKELKAIQLPI